MNGSTQSALDGDALDASKAKTTYDVDLVEGTMLESPYAPAQSTSPARSVAPATVHAMPLNVGSVERIISLFAGALGLFFLSRRLLTYVLLTAASSYLIFRGLTGHCSLYKAARIDGRSFKPGEKIGAGLERLDVPDVQVPDLPDIEGAAKSLLNKVRGGSTGGSQQSNSQHSNSRVEQAEMHDQVHGDVEEASWESFPASDPPATW